MKILIIEQREPCKCLLSEEQFIVDYPEMADLDGAIFLEDKNVFGGKMNLNENSRRV